MLSAKAGNRDLVLRETAKRYDEIHERPMETSYWFAKSNHDSSIQIALKLAGVASNRCQMRVLGRPSRHLRRRPQLCQSTTRCETQSFRDVLLCKPIVPSLLKSIPLSPSSTFLNLQQFELPSISSKCHPPYFPPVSQSQPSRPRQAFSRPLRTSLSAVIPIQRSSLSPLPPAVL